MPTPFPCPHCEKAVTDEELAEAVLEEHGPYKIVRFYSDAPGMRRTIKRGLTLSEAQAHCKDPEGSSRTCTTRAGRRRTEQYGAWFDGYTRE